MRSLSAMLILGFALAPAMAGASQAGSGRAVARDADGTFAIREDIHAEPVSLWLDTDGLIDDRAIDSGKKARAGHKAGQRETLREEGIEDNLREAFEEALDIARFDG